jgi:hypothetical protein
MQAVRVAPPFAFTAVVSAQEKETSANTHLPLKSPLRIAFCCSSAVGKTLGDGRDEFFYSSWRSNQEKSFGRGRIIPNVQRSALINGFLFLRLI